MNENGTAITETLFALGIILSALGGFLLLIFCSGLRHHLDFAMYEALLCKFEKSSHFDCDSTLKKNLKMILPQNTKIQSSWAERKDRKYLKVYFQSPFADFNFKKRLDRTDIPFFEVSNPDPLGALPRIKNNSGMKML